MKSVLISIQPKWCELIASGKKTIEVRRTRPTIQTPFKCYIYKTKKRILRDVAHKGEALWGCEKIADKTEIVSCPDLDGGKVIGEFVCDRIDSYIKEENNRYWWTFCSTEEIEEIKEKTRLTLKELVGYTGDSKHLYAWHISDLNIYDKPFLLNDFGITFAPQSWRYLLCTDTFTKQQT